MKRGMEARCASDTPSSEYAQEPLEAGHEPTTEPTTEDTPFYLTEEEGIRRWKAEQANKALWDFGGRMRQVQQDWRRLQEEIRAAPPKRRRPAPQPPYSGPLLLLNQWYWEQSLGASISSITGDNMFGINMFLPHRQQQQPQANNDSAAAGPCSSSSNTPAPAAAAAGAPDSSNSKKRRLTTSQADDATADATSEHSCPGSVTRATSSDGGSSSSSVVDVDAALLPPAPAAAAAPAPTAAAAAAAPAEVYDFAEIEAVCQQQKLTHLPASRRFVRALRIIRAAKQQEAAAAALELNQQQQQGMAVVQPGAGASLVAVV